MKDKGGMINEQSKIQNLKSKIHTFSQSSLQDFDTCARRFQLRYLDNLRWPAIESEPVQEAERLAQLGADFHRLVHQHLAGVDVETLTVTLPAAKTDLQRWWQNYLTHCPAPLSEAEIYPELALSAPLGGYRLFARFDVLAVTAGNFTIIDWKTSTHKPPRTALEQRMQTRVYPYVLAAAGAAFNQGRSIKPNHIKMIYWYPHLPDEPEIFNYSKKLQRRDEQFLNDLIDRISHAARHTNFPLAADDKPCRHCVYRSLCNRGQRAGTLAAPDEESPDVLDVSALDWDQIAEIQF